MTPEKKEAYNEAIKTVLRQIVADFFGFAITFGIVDILADALIRMAYAQYPEIDPKTAGIVSIVVWFLSRYVIHAIDRIRFLLSEHKKGVLPTFTGREMI